MNQKTWISKANVLLLKLWAHATLIIVGGWIECIDLCEVLLMKYNEKILKMYNAIEVFLIIRLIIGTGCKLN